jgi:hypothetical protein
MPSYSTNLVTDTLQVNEILTPVETKNITSDGTVEAVNITSTGTINWNSFNPPLVVSGSPGLNLVLGAGNNAGTQDINDVSSLTFDKNAGDPISAIVGDATNTTQCYHLDLTDASNTFPSSLAGDLNATLQLGNTANGQSITGLAGLTLNASATIQGDSTNKTVVSNCDLSSATNVFPPSLNEDIEGTLIAGNDANGQSMIGLNGVGAVGVQATTVSSTVVNAGSVTITSDSTPLSGILNLNVSAINQTVKLDFTGTAQNAGQDTEIEGDTTVVAGQPKLTKCTYLDLSDATNRLPSDAITDFSWGVVFRPFPQLTLDFDDTPAVVMHENFFFDFSSTNPAHATCLLDTNFFINFYGYGYISLLLFWQRTDGSNARVEYPGSYLNFVASESATAFRSVRKVGQVFGKMIVDNLPTDGISYRFWLGVRSNWNDNGRMGVNISIDNRAPNEPSAQGGNAAMYLKPFPTNIRLAS